MAEIIGHKLAIKYLEQAVKQNNIAHAYLLTGPQGVGKTALTRYFIELLNGKVNNADVMEVGLLEGKKEITIDQVRGVIDFLQLGSWSTGYRVAVIEPADRLNIESSNALLKTLEEPLGKAVIVLITARPSGLLSTIISRCQLINLSPVSFDNIKDWLKQLDIPKARIEELAHLAQGSPGRAYQVWQNDEQWQKTISIGKDFIRLLQLRYLNNDSVKAATPINLDTLTAEEAEKTTVVYLELARDLLLCKYSGEALIRFYPLQAEMVELIKFIDANRLVGIIEALQTTLIKLRSNANIKLTFEWLFVNLTT